MKRVTSKGKTYFYHRKTRKRLSGAPGSAEFIQSYRDAESEPKQVHAAPGSFGALIEAYMKSPEFTDLAGVTRKDYRQMIEILRPAIYHRPVSAITTDAIFTLRDRIAEKRNWRTANYCLAVMSRIFSVCRLRGLVSDNPVKDIPKLKRPKAQRQVNRPWSDAELEAVFRRSPPMIALAVALGAYTGLREGDVLSLTWDAVRDGWIDVTQSKTDDPVWVPVHRSIRPALAMIHGTTRYLVESRRKDRYSSDGFRTILFRIIKELEAEGTVEPGLTFHGLRHTVATKLADAGADAQTIMSVTGHRSSASLQKYIKRADSRSKARRGMSLLEGGSGRK